MNDKSMSFSVNKDLDVHSKSFDAFISYMENSNDFWIIKDPDYHRISASLSKYSGIGAARIHE